MPAATPAGHRTLRLSTSGGRAEADALLKGAAAKVADRPGISGDDCGEHQPCRAHWVLQHAAGVGGASTLPRAYVTWLSRRRREVAGSEAIVDAFVWACFHAGRSEVVDSYAGELSQSTTQVGLKTETARESPEHQVRDSTMIGTLPMIATPEMPAIRSAPPATS